MTMMLRRIFADSQSFHRIVEQLTEMNLEFRTAVKHSKALEEQMAELDDASDSLYQEAHRLVQSADLSDAEIQALDDAGLLPDDWDADRAPSTAYVPEED